MPSLEQMYETIKRNNGKTDPSWLKTIPLKEVGQALRMAGAFVAASTGLAPGTQMNDEQKKEAVLAYVKNPDKYADQGSYQSIVPYLKAAGVQIRDPQRDGSDRKRVEP